MFIGVVSKIHVAINYRALQELHIAFKPETSAPFLQTPSVGSVSQDGLKDTLSDLSLASDAVSVSQSDISRHSLSYGDQTHRGSEASQNRYEMVFSATCVVCVCVQ